ncbi:tRNA pseudouridine synthase B [Clostridia bacterium]|nr:tRNA pseudouridine synthase B [Clostridia bacterium]
MPIVGVVNIFKEQNFTSHDVVAVVRKILGERRVGHTGTLDPMATGVLPVCVGTATKIADYIQNGDKTYRAVMRLGVTTDTEDISGTVLCEKEVSVSEEDVRSAAAGFVGDISQTPPMYSAVKVNGQKLYKLARTGKEIERPARRISVHGINIGGFLPEHRVTLTIDCSKGTYIRTLIKDIGAKLGCGACMESLTRTKTGSFCEDTAITLDRLRETVSKGDFSAVRPIDKVLDFPKIYTRGADKILHNGGAIDCAEYGAAREKQYLVYDSECTLCGIYTCGNGTLIPDVILYRGL